MTCSARLEQKEVPEMETNTYTMPAPAAAVRTRAQASMWAAVPAKGIRMPFAGTQLHGIAVLTNAMRTADAAQGTTYGATKNAKGDEAFEDPV
jgi:hypothetical protein